MTWEENKAGWFQKSRQEEHLQMKRWLRQGLRAPSVLRDTVVEATWKGLERVGSEERMPARKTSFLQTSQRGPDTCVGHTARKGRSYFF